MLHEASLNGEVIMLTFVTFNINICSMLRTFIHITLQYKQMLKVFIVLIKLLT